MGLLTRLNGVRQQAADNNLQDNSLEQKTEKILNGIEASPNQIDYPGSVLKAFSSLTGSDRGAVLLPDSGKKIFIPWLVNNLDRTTARKLNIPFSDDPEKNMNTRISIVSNVSDYADFFSSRELELTDNILHINLTEENNIHKDSTGVILLTNLDRMILQDNQLTPSLEKFCSFFSEKLRESRKIIGNLPEADDPVPLQQWLNVRKDSDSAIIILDFALSVEKIISALPGLDVFRLQKDIVSLVKVISGRMGRVYDLKDSRALLQFPAEVFPEPDLYLHQLTHSFRTYFYNIPGPPYFNAEFHKWPEERKALEKKLSKFF